MIYNPIDTSYVISSANMISPASDELDDYIINVGSFKQAKRHDILLQAFAKSETQSKLVLLGKGPLLEDAKNLAIKLGIADRVIFAGFRLLGDICMLHLDAKQVMF